MTEKLDPHAPTPERLSSIRHLLQRAGIPEEAIPNDWVAATLAAMEKWMLTTEDGLKYASQIFKFQIKQGEDTNEYILVDNINRCFHSLKNTQVWFYEGYLVDGVPVPLATSRDENFIPPYELEFSEMSKIKCDSCGIVSHCTKEVLDPFTDSLLQICNFCLSNYAHQRVREQGDFSKCEGCKLSQCSNHPHNAKTLKKSAL